MRLIEFLLPFKHLTRVLTAFSVRTRIVVLALIPVAGFIANGLTYVAGETDVGTAFETVKRSGALADASRDFKSAVTGMRIIVRDFTVSPNDNLVVSFEQTHAQALLSLDNIAAAVDRRHAENIVALRRDVLELSESFTDLVRQQKILGFDETSGLRGNLLQASNAVERIINENMTWLAEADATKLMMALLIMRHHEAEYRLSQMELTRQQFLADYKKFNNTFAQIDGTPEMKESLEHQVKAYADTFAQWIEGFDRVRPLRVVIDIDSQRMLPRADEIIDQARADRGSGVSGARRVAGAHAHRHHRGRHRHGRARPRLQLADRTQHHASAQRSGRRDEAARRRRYQRAHSGHPRARRDRRDGAHRDRVPRHHDRARKPGADAGRSQPRARAAQRHDFARPSGSSSIRSKTRSASCARRR